MSVGITLPARRAAGGEARPGLPPVAGDSE